MCAIGSSPGFGYLHGLDPRIFMPRKTVPSLRMLKAHRHHRRHCRPAFSASTGPNGWNAIGWAATTDVRSRQGPALPARAGGPDPLRCRADRAVIEVVSSPPLNTVQDLGRFGSRHYGVSTSGVMDPVALVVGNVLLRQSRQRSRH